jgi:hypothetical protein
MKDITSAGLLSGKGPIIVGKTPGGLDFPAIVEGKGDHLEVTLHTGSGTARQIIPLTETPVHFGGTRPWFLCPRCGRRCGVLYGRSEFACRSCLNLRYTSQFESPRERMLRQLLKIRKVIGADMDVYGPLSPPPRGMSKKKWQRLCDEHEALRKKLFREYERPRAWRNGAPRAEDWKVGVTVPSKHLA